MEQTEWKKYTARGKKGRDEDLRRSQEKKTHLLVLRFLHSLVDMTEDLSTAVGCLLNFLLLRGIV